MAILVTGTAGFIGFHLAKQLLKEGKEVIGVDNLNDYYDVEIKKRRNEILKKDNNYEFLKLDLKNNEDLVEKTKDKEIDQIVHLAAQAGVRYSLKRPRVYEYSNNLGTLNIFELARNKNIPKVVFASSSSVYGGNKEIPFSEKDNVDKPISLYAATKKYNELLAHAYHDLYGMEAVGLRFFTVYGEWGRPDMAAWIFVKNMLQDKEIEVYNHGQMERDFTYVKDVVEGTRAVMNKKFKYEIFNLGNSKPIKLGYFIELIEKYLGKKAKKKMLPMQKGDVKRTYADLKKSKEMLGYEPKVSIEEGMKKFVSWFKDNEGWIIP